MAAYSETEFGLVAQMIVGGDAMLVLVCPGCGQRGYLDDDQAHGRVSVDHAADGCAGGYHETHDFWAAAEAAGWEER
jgi:hypothetical protein